MMRWLAIPVGLAGSAIALYLGGAIMFFAACEGDYGPARSALCAHVGVLVLPLELHFLALGVLAPRAGAIATVTERQARWIGYGLAGAVVAVAALGVLAAQQASLLSY
jgi:hypothetical protein